MSVTPRYVTILDCPTCKEPLGGLVGTCIPCDYDRYFDTGELVDRGALGALLEAVEHLLSLDWDRDGVVIEHLRAAARTTRSVLDGIDYAAVAAGDKKDDEDEDEEEEAVS
jgi:hypothetical protein